MLREGMRLLCRSRREFSPLLEELFGGEDTAENGIGRVAAPGRLRVGPASLDRTFRDAILCLEDREERRRCLGDLAIIRRQTAIQHDTGVASCRSLRSTECGIAGLSFTASLTVAAAGEGAGLATLLDRICRMIRSMGVGRNRGLGRVCFRFEPAGGDRS